VNMRCLNSSSLQTYLLTDVVLTSVAKSVDRSVILDNRLLLPLSAQIFDGHLRIISSLMRSSEKFRSEY
jgi:hypothetical protein